MKKINTFVIPIIQGDFLPRMLETLYRYTEKDSFNVIVIDNTGNDAAQKVSEKYTHMWIKPYRNLGFAQSMNLGARVAQTKYVTFANDDLEFLDSRWWQGILDTFASDQRIVAVNPMSPREGSWGYGFRSDNKDTWQPPKGFAVCDETKEAIVPIINGKPFLYKPEYTKEEYDGLLNNHPTWNKDSMCDGIATWMTVMRREDIIGKTARIGLFDENFFPGGGEDMDLNGRAYSCAWPIERDECDNDYHLRMVGTTKSWVFHWWSKSQKISAETPNAPLFNGRERWNSIPTLWPNGFDVWGHKDENGKRIPYKRIPKVFLHEL